MTTLLISRRHNTSDYTDFIQKHALTPDERKIVLLALAPEVQPEMLDRFLIRSQTYDKMYTEFGEIATRSFNGFIPTIKTALFLLGGHRSGEQNLWRCGNLFGVAENDGEAGTERDLALGGGE